MKGDDFLKNLKNIDDDIIAESEDIRPKRNRKNIIRGVLAAACILIAVIGAYNAGWMNIKDKNDTAMNEVEDKKSTLGEEIKKDNAEEIIEKDNSPVNYNDLKLPKGEGISENISSMQNMSLDIAAFTEDSCLKECCGIIEGTVTNMYAKNYDYDIYSDKFEKNGILHAKASTVVYEISIDKVWYGEGFLRGTILIEDQYFWEDEILAMKKGCRYVIPICNTGDKLFIPVHEYAGGDIERDSIYSTLYPFHPQIEATEDNQYVVSNDWTTLCAAGGRNIIIDGELSDGWQYYKDKMVLIDSDTFTNQMNLLIEEKIAGK